MTVSSRQNVRTSGLWLLLAWAACGPGCSDTERSPTAAFASPMGLAVAGSARDMLFVANTGEDALQVVQLTPELGDLDFIPSPAQYFPLRIPAGPSPTHVVASHDGRFVVALDAVSGLMRLVDADALALVRTGGVVQQVPVSAAGAMAHASAVVSSPVACPEGACAGMFYVALAARGEVAEFVILTDGAGARIEPRRILAVGGQPTHLAAHPDGHWLFAADAATPELVRISLDTAAADRMPLGGVGGAMAVSTDGVTLVVARPALHDVVLLRDLAASTPSVVDANPFFAPLPECVAACDNAAACVSAHPADQAVCASASGLATGAGGAYQSLYLGVVPSHITMVGAAAGHPSLAVSCQDAVREFTEVAVVASLDGTVRFVGLAGAADAELVAEGWCSTPAIQPTPGTTAALKDFLAPCPEHPGDRRRFACALPTQGEPTAGVVVQRGHATGASWAFAWEGILPGLQRKSGGGEIDDDGSFRDLGINLPEAYAAGTVKDGDVLEITTPPLGDAQCLEALEQNNALCNLERRIRGVTPEGSLLLDRPLPVACYGKGGRIAYNVRAGDTFMVTPPGGGAVRLAPGGRFGPGAGVGDNQPVLFQVQAFDVRADLGACQRYAPGPNDELPLGPLLVRNRAFGFQVLDGLFPVRSGLQFDQQGREIGSVGRIPGGVVVAQGVTSQPVVFLTYAGTDTLLAFVPFDTGTMFSDRNYHILR